MEPSSNPSIASSPSSQESLHIPDAASVSSSTKLRHNTFNFLPASDRWPNGSSYSNVELGLLGKHQVANAAVVIAGLEILREHGRSIPEVAFRTAFQTTQIPGRIQILSERPLVILDTAHNEASIAALVKTLDDHFPPLKRTFVFSSSRDKQWRKMLELLLPAGDRFILTQFQHNPRAVPVEQLYDAMKEIASQTNHSPQTEILQAPSRPKPLLW